MRRASGRTEEARRRRWPSAGSQPVTLTDLLIAVLARTLATHPQLNSSWTGEGIRPNPDVNISLAVAVKDGVVGAVIHRANILTISEISAQRMDLRERAPRGASAPRGYFRRNVHSQQSGHVQSRWLQCHHHAAAGCRLGHRRDPRSRGRTECQPKVRPMMTITLSRRSPRGGWRPRRRLSWRVGRCHQPAGKVVELRS